MDLNQDQDLGLKRLRSGLVFGLDSGSIPGFKIKRLGSGSGFGLGLGHFRVFSAFRQIPEVQQIPDFPTHQNISQEGVRKTGGVWTIDKWSATVQNCTGMTSRLSFYVLFPIIFNASPGCFSNVCHNILHVNINIKHIVLYVINWSTNAYPILSYRELYMRKYEIHFECSPCSIPLSTRKRKISLF